MTFETLAAAFPTPFYAYNADLIARQCSRMTEGFAGQKIDLRYAIKANDNPEILKIVASHGIGACLVSSGELTRALASGIRQGNMLMNGIGKTENEIRSAIAAGIGQLNIESLPELERVSAIAAEMGKRIVICLRINPDIAANTHTHTATARRTDKFGLLVEDLPAARTIIAASPSLDWRGYSCHIGSQIHGVAELADSYRYMVDLFAREKQTQTQFDRLDLGGGFGVSYSGDAYAQPADYAALVGDLTSDLQAQGVRIQVEPGRYIVAEAGTLVTRVQYVKDSGGMRFVIVDAAMNDLIRPALYGAYHPIKLARASTAPMQSAAIVGPVCESADYFAKDEPLPGDVAQGDILAIGFAGAYGAAMGSFYNARSRLAEVLVENGTPRLIRKSFTAADYDAATLL